MNEYIGLQSKQIKKQLVLFLNTRLWGTKTLRPRLLISTSENVFHVCRFSKILYICKFQESKKSGVFSLIFKVNPKVRTLASLSPISLGLSLLSSHNTSDTSKLNVYVLGCTYVCSFGQLFDLSDGAFVVQSRRNSCPLYFSSFASHVMLGGSFNWSLSSLCLFWKS